VLVTTTLPWVHDDKYNASIEEAMANRRAATAQHAAMLAEVRARVAAAWERLQATARIVELYRTSLIAQSEQSLQAARSAYEAGTAGFVTVVDNERTLLLNRLALARAEADYGRASADLYEAIGVVGPADLADPLQDSAAAAFDTTSLDTDLAGVSPDLAKIFPNRSRGVQERER
jgi:outer membrane protein TolC